MPHLITCDLACLAIAGLYYTWRDAYRVRRAKAVLRERVSLMLWAVAARTAA